MRRDVFQAIADPNRRAIIGLLAERKKMNVNGVAERFKISRPAVSKHLKILAECGLVVTSQEGRDKYCEVTLERLGEVSDWLEQYRKFWEHTFDALGDYLREIQEKEKRNASKRK